MSALHLIWDLDGTLIDSESEVLSSLELALADVGVPPSARRSPLRVGPTIDVMLRDAYSPEALSDEDLQKAIGRFRDRYDNSSFSLTRAIDGLDEIVRNTERFTHHVVTNKPDFPTNRILGSLGWAGFFASVSTPYSRAAGAAASVPASKRRKAELFKDIVDGDSSGTFVGIGDMAPDCIAAKACGIPAIGVLWGTGTEEELREAGCDTIVRTPAELSKALLGLAVGSRS